MISFNALIEKFEDKGEKTGWSYIVVSAHIAQQILPNNKKSFRVKGQLNDFVIRQVATLPMGNGDFIIPINANIRKGTQKKEGAHLLVQLSLDDSPLEQSAELLDCLADEPKALAYFEKLPKGHQNYYSNWVEEAKTVETKSRRIAMCVNGMAMGMGYGQMVRYYKGKKQQ